MPIPNPKRSVCSHTVCSFALSSLCAWLFSVTVAFTLQLSPGSVAVAFCQGAFWSLLSLQGSCCFSISCLRSLAATLSVSLHSSLSFHFLLSVGFLSSMYNSLSTPQDTFGSTSGQPPSPGIVWWRQMLSSSQVEVMRSCFVTNTQSPPASGFLSCRLLAWWWAGRQISQARYLFFP